VGGKLLFTAADWDIPNALASVGARGENIVSWVGWDGLVRGVIVTRDSARPEWRKVAEQITGRCRLVLLTGAEHAGSYADFADTTFSGVPPEGKAAVIRQLRREGTVVMVGDGSNDAPALAAADLGIAFGAPTALAAEAADLIIPGERLERIFPALDLIHTIRRRVRQNLGWALMYNAIAIPLALSGLLNPLFAALAMSSSSLLVVWNSARPVQLSAIIDDDHDHVSANLDQPSDRHDHGH
jgi:Cu2+-exporting ATPase